MSAPKRLNQSNLVSETCAGTKAWHGNPQFAANPASEIAAFPADAQYTSLAPDSIASAIPTAVARSFRHLVGLRVSSLIRTRARPSRSAILGAETKGVPPAGKISRGSRT